MSERVLFEAWISTKEFINAGMGGRGVEDILIFDEDSQSYHFRTIQECWEAWQASANRQGYKLVPINYECHWCGCTELDGFKDKP